MSIASDAPESAPPTTAAKQQFRYAASKRQPDRVLVLFVPSGSGPLFAGTRQAEQRASTTAVDGRLPFRLEKEERCGYYRGSLLQIVQTRSQLEVGADYCFQRVGVSWLHRVRLTRLVRRPPARAGEAAIRRRRARALVLVVPSISELGIEPGLRDGIG